MIDAAVRAAIVAEWRRLAAEPVPPDRKPVGCVAAILGLVVLAGAPYFLKQIGWKLLDAVVLGSALVALVWGLVVGFFTGNLGARHFYGRLEEAQAWFEAHRGEAGTAASIGPAVALVYYARLSNGPSMSRLLDADAARARLGDAAAFVEDVERVLVDEVQAWPVLTTRAEQN